MRLLPKEILPEALKNLQESSPKDQIFREPSRESLPFAFDGAVARVFDDMAQRSIPLYTELQLTTARLAETFAAPGSHIYDLGCATGTSLLCIASRLLDPSIRLIGIDSSAPMLDEFRERLQRFTKDDPTLSERIKLHQADICSFPLTQASFVVAHYTLQFLSPAQRLPLLKRIRQSGAVLLLSEKATHEHSSLDAILSGLYYDFKRKNGYSELEISQKREALENVLIPFSVEQTLELLREAGFQRVELVAKCFQFCTFLAIPEETNS